MEKRFVRLSLIMLVLSMMIALSGCGMDTSKAAGNISDSTSETAADVTDAQDRYDEQSSTASGAGTIYDSTDFLKKLSAWNGEPYCEINNNKPDFSENEIWRKTQESLDPLDALGRCGTANSCIGLDGMPTKPRGNISEIHPTGWHTDSYSNVEGGKLYNRCHLIAHKLSGDDAIARNLITGTSYMNREGMLPFEDRIEQYVKETGNHVMYRVTPCFAGDELVARGVHMQAISVEDNGAGLAFNVFCYNVQPGIEIDYATGDNWRSGDENSRNTQDNSAVSGDDNSSQKNYAADQEEEQAPDQSGNQESQVLTYYLNTNTKKFHHEWCDSVKQMKEENKRKVETSREDIIAHGFSPCGNCKP